MDSKIEKLLSLVGEGASSLKTTHERRSEETDQKAHKFTTSERFLLIAAAALDLAEANRAHDRISIPGDSDLQNKEITRIRKLLGKELCLLEDTNDYERKVKKSEKREREEMDEVTEAIHCDLGQYAHTKVFSGNLKKTEKFARLMGGLKNGGTVVPPGTPPTSPSLHPTYAPSTERMKKISHDIESQFMSAIQHKGKKGLGV